MNHLTNNNMICQLMIVYVWAVSKNLVDHWIREGPLATKLEVENFERFTTETHGRILGQKHRIILLAIPTCLGLCFFFAISLAIIGHHYPSLTIMNHRQSFSHGVHWWPSQGNGPLRFLFLSSLLVLCSAPCWGSGWRALDGTCDMGRCHPRERGERQLGNWWKPWESTATYPFCWSFLVWPGYSSAKTTGSMGKRWQTLRVKLHLWVNSW